MAEPNTPNESAFGVLRIKAGPDGGAVRLGVLVRDLMKRHDMARDAAVTDLLLARLQGDSPPAVYLLPPAAEAASAPAATGRKPGSAPRPGRADRR